MLPNPSSEPHPTPLTLTLLRGILSRFQTIEEQKAAKEEVDGLLEDEKKKCTILSGEVSL